MTNIFFESWDSVLRTIIISVLAYFTMIVLLRISGKRTLSQMNAFDFIVTVSLGSALASAIVTKNVTLADGVTAFVMLIILQFIITYLSVRIKKVDKFVKSSPTLLVYQGNFLEENLKRERVSRDEIKAAVRQVGLGSLHDADAIVLETNGSISVVHKSKMDETTKPEE